MIFEWHVVINNTMLSRRFLQTVVLLSAALVNAKPQEIRGHLKSVDACADPGVVQYVQIFEVGTSLVVVWQAPIGAEDCYLNYKVEYTTRDVVQSSITDELHYTFEFNPYPCVIGSVTIVPVSKDGIDGITYSAEYGGTFDGLQVVTLNEENGVLGASWVDPPNSEYCYFVYTVEFQSEEETYTYETAEKNFFFEGHELTPCVVNKVTVTPTSGSLKGKSTAVNHEAVVGPVENFELSSVNGELAAKWDTPLNTDRCELSYELGQTDKDCFTQSVTVFSISQTGKHGLNRSGEIETEISPVGSLAVQFNNGLLAVGWTRPENAVQCFIKYAVTIDDGDIYKTEGTSINIEANPKPCYLSQIRVRPLSITGKFGVEATTQYVRGIDAINGLTLERNEQILVATWVSPTDTDLCVLSYLVEYNDGTGTHITVTDSLSFEFAYVSCNAASVTVTPHTDSGIVGSSTTATYQGGCKHEANEPATVQL